MKHFILFGLLLISGCLYAQDEIYIGASEVDTFYYIESQSCDSYLDRYKIWIKAVPRKPQVINKRTYTGTYDLRLFLIDYSSNKIGILKAITYNKDGSKVLKYKTFDDELIATLEDVIPGSIGAEIFKKTYDIIHPNI